MLSYCKILGELRIMYPHLRDYDLDGLDAVQSCTNNRAIKLTLIIVDMAKWVVLKLFQIIHLELGHLGFILLPEVKLSDITCIMDLIHQNYRLVFDAFTFETQDSALTPLFISQMTDLQHLELRFARHIHSNLNNLKSLTKLKSLKLNIIWTNDELDLNVDELQQLEKLKIVNGMSVKSTLKISRGRQMTALKELTIINFQITRNQLQLIFTKMPSLGQLHIISLI
jgi:hypothetical protein